MPRWLLLSHFLLVGFLPGCGPQAPNIAGSWAGELVREDAPGSNVPVKLEFLPGGSYSVTIKGAPQPRMGRYRWADSYHLILDHEWNELDYHAVVKIHRYRHPNTPLPPKNVQLRFIALVDGDRLSLASQDGQVFWNVPAGYPVRINLTRQKS